MSADEREIFEFLKAWGGHDFINGAEVCRRAGGKKKFNANPNWAKQHLLNMEGRGILESDNNGRYRIKPVPKAKKKWVSPEIEKILGESGIKVPGATSTDIASDDYYDGL